MNLQKSLHQLDESTSKRRLIRTKESRKPQQRFDDMDTDLSITVAPNEIRRLMDNTNTFSNTSLFISQSVHSGSQSNLSVMAKQKTDHLYSQFLEIIQSRTNDSEIFETVQDLIMTLSNTIEDMETDKRSVKLIGDSWIKQEQITWKLLYCLYKDRLITQKEVNEIEDLPLVSSEKRVVEHLYLTNSNLREYQLIVDWLEQTALENHQLQVAHYTDRTIAWENTLHQLQNLGDTVFGGGREIVKSLDPDAPHREKLPLHDLDAEDQNRISKQILLEIRQGRIDEAQNLCEHCGQPWRAALLEGWRLHHDPNFDGNEPNDIKMPIEGNPRRDLWKRCAWMMAESKKIDSYSRAIAGVFCGNLESMTGVLSDSWMDLLWAFLKVQIDIRVESEIRSYCVKNYESMPEKYWNSKMSLEQIFTELEAHNNATVKVSARSTVNIIQKYLILDDIQALMRHIEQWLDEDVHSTISPQMLRFLTHLVLFIRQIGRNHQEEIGDKVIKCYVQCLIKLGDAQLVAFYTAALPSELQIYLYSEYLETITETNNRKASLEEGQSHGIDIFTVAAKTVDRVRKEQEENSDMKPLEGVLSALDKKKVSSLELLTFYPEQRGELLWQANAMMRTFLAENKIEASKKAFGVIPVDSIQIIMSNFGGKKHLPGKEECSIKEYLCHQTYLAAIEGYNDWIEFYYHQKPKEPHFAQTKNFTERVEVEHQEQIYRSEMDRWKTQLVEQTKVARDLLYNVLLFPERGWMVDPEDDSYSIPEELAESWTNRHNQMENLRKLHIPEVVLLLYKILTLSGQHKDCLKLCDELASETNKLYQVYSKHKLAEIIAKIADASLALMNEEKTNDPFGYSNL